MHILSEISNIGKMIIGVDVAKEWIDAAVAGDSRVRRIVNSERATAAWLVQIGAGSIGLVAFEPTSVVMSGMCAGAFSGRKLPQSKVHPNEVVAYRRRRGIKAKTDRIDARLLADFAVVELARREFEPVPRADEVLRELASRRRQLQSLLHAETCRCDVADSAIVRKSLQAVIATDKSVADHIESSPQAETSQRLQIFCGVDPAISRKH
jgi:transposase